MCNEESFSDLREDIDGYKRRVMILDNFVLIEYSKKALFSRYINPKSFSKEEIKENLLFDAVAPNEEEAIKLMKEKIRDYEVSNGVA